MSATIKTTRSIFYFSLVVLAGCSEKVSTADRSGDGPPTTSSSTGSVVVDSTNWARVDSTMGRPASVQVGDVHRFSFPRSDLRVRSAGVEIKPALALGGWLAMKPAKGGAVAMGDLVLTEDELTPVITSLQASGIEQTAIHHHLLHDVPKIVYVHVHAHGSAENIAAGVAKALAFTGTPTPTTVPAAATEIAIDTAAIAKKLGAEGRVNGGVYQVSVARAETIRDDDFEVPSSMGLSTAMNFQPTGGGKAAVTGDFVMIGSEVNNVIRALRDGGIEVTSLHNHMLNEQPRLFFMHFWANDDAVKLATTLGNALAKTNSKRAPSR